MPCESNLGRAELGVASLGGGGGVREGRTGCVSLKSGGGAAGWVNPCGVGGGGAGGSSSSSGVYQPPAVFPVRNGSVASMERIGAAEGRSCSSSGGGSTPVTPPSSGCPALSASPGRFSPSSSVESPDGC